MKEQGRLKLDKPPSKKSGMDFFDKLIARELLAPGRFFYLS